MVERKKPRVAVLLRDPRFSYCGKNHYLIQERPHGSCVGYKRTVSRPCEPVRKIRVFLPSGKFDNAFALQLLNYIVYLLPVVHELQSMPQVML
jgi:hypothetical protein